MAAAMTNQHSTPETDDLQPNDPTPDNSDVSGGLDLQPAKKELELTGREPPPEDEDGEGPKPFVDHKRNAIFAKAREKRQAETTEFTGSQHDKDVLYGRETNADQVSDLEKNAFGKKPEAAQPDANQQQTQPPVQQQQQPAQQPRTMSHLDPAIAQQKVTLIIDGQPREVTVEEMARNYQIDGAAVARLEQANRVLAAAKETVRAPAYQPEPQGGQQEEPGNTQPPAVPEGLKAVVEKLQFGTPEEGALALQTYVDGVVNQRGPQFDPYEAVDARLEDHKTRSEIRAYAEANPDIADPRVQLIMQPESQRAMIDDLLQHMPIEQLRIRATNPDALKVLHARARAEGLPGVRSVSQILTYAHEQVKAFRNGGQPPQGGNPQPQPSLQERAQRKEGLTNQPALRRQAPTPPNQQPRSQEQSRTDAVAQIRRARGQGR